MKKYKYWVVECYADSRHLIPIRNANGIDGRPVVLSWPERFHARCPHDGKAHTYRTTDAWVEENIKFPLIPVSQLPKLSKRLSTKSYQ